MSILQKLDINTQKDEIIARLLLQRYYGVHCSGGVYSRNEIDHVLKYATEADQKLYFEAFEALQFCSDGEKYYQYLLTKDDDESF